MIGVTFVYAVFAGLQWGAIKETARASHETITKMNRPWIAIKMSNPPSTTRPPRILDQATPIRIIYSPYNRGNSLAWVTSVWMKACTLPAEGVLPEKPDYWTEPCGVTLRDCEILVEPGGGIPSPAYVPAGVFQGVYAKETFLHIYGILTYRDAWDQPHETRFCYCYYVSSGPNDVLAEAFYPVGPKEYNKQT
jgi:hypothetical protein